MTVPIGTILAYGGSAAPAEYLLCYGQAVSRTDYSALFSVIGTTFGTGDGSTTFNLPDLRGRVPAGQDDMGGTSANRLTGQSGGVDGDTLGAVGGEETHTLTVSELAAHTHRIGYTPSSTTGSVSFGVPTVNVTSKVQANVIENTGGDSPHNNIQPTIILNYIIHTGAEANNYVAENGVDAYVTEDGTNNYVTEM